MGIDDRYDLTKPYQPATKGRKKNKIGIGPMNSTHFINPVDYPIFTIIVLGLLIGSILFALVYAAINIHQEEKQSRNKQERRRRNRMLTTEIKDRTKAAKPVQRVKRVARIIGNSISDEITAISTRSYRNETTGMKVGTMGRLEIR